MSNELYIMDKILLCAIAKCENKYIMEWIAWHLRLGFDKIVIYDNNDIGGEKISDTVGDLQNVEILNWRGKKSHSCEVQVRAYNDCYKKHPNWDWIMFLDIDEFLEFKNGIGIHEYLSDNEWIKNASAIKFHWKCYSDNGFLYGQSGKVTEIYTQLCTNSCVNTYTKTLYRGGMENFKIINVHYSSMIHNIYYQNGKGCIHSYKTKDDNINYDCGWIRHYITKSLEEFIYNKFARRNPGTSKHRLNMDFYFRHNERTEEKCKLFSEMISKLAGVQHQMKENKPVWTMQVAKKREPICVKNVKRHAQKKEELQQDEGVSICISAWNTQDYIEECLDSVERQTWFKTHNNWEVIVGIDGCEKTLKKVKEIMSKYRNLKVFMMDSNKGAYVTCNTIMKEARYEWLLRFDSDDIMHPNMVETIMAEKDDAKFVRWKMQNFGLETNVKNTCGQQLLHKSVFSKFNGYKDWICGADSDMIEKCARYVNHKIIQKVLMDRRVHESSLTVKKDTSINSEFRKKYIDYTTNKENYINIDACINKTCVTNTYKQVVPDTIIVTFTTWKKRELCVPQMLEHFKQQTVKPDKIICWLSSDEYNGENIPKSLQKFVDEKYIEVKWVKENIYGHKRWEALKHYHDCYVITIDDDIYYPKTYIEELYTTAKKYPECFITYYSGIMNFIGTTKIRCNTQAGQIGIDIETLSGLSCIPPNVFPMKMFDYYQLRDKYCPICDDSWVNAWRIKYGINSIAVHPFTKLNCIDGTQTEGIWNTYNSKLNDNVLQKVKNAAMCAMITNQVDKYKKIWPQFNIEKCATVDQNDVIRNV